MRRVLALCVLLAGCQGSATGVVEQIEGNWMWVESSGGIAGRQLTPASEGYSARLELLPDGRARGFRNDSLVATSQVTIQERLVLVAPGSPREFEVHFEPPLQLLPFSALDTHVVRFGESGTITLESPCCDMYNHTFAAAAAP